MQPLFLVDRKNNNELIEKGGKIILIFNRFEKKESKKLSFLNRLASLTLLTCTPNPFIILTSLNLLKALIGTSR